MKPLTKVESRGWGDNTQGWKLLRFQEGALVAFLGQHEGPC